MHTTPLVMDERSRPLEPFSSVDTPPRHCCRVDPFGLPIDGLRLFGFH